MSVADKNIKDNHYKKKCLYLIIIKVMNLNQSQSLPIMIPNQIQSLPKRDLQIIH
jgi:hypothetical protein